MGWTTVLEEFHVFNRSARWRWATTFRHGGICTQGREREKTKTKRKTGSILVLRKTIFFFCRDFASLLLPIRRLTAPLTDHRQSKELSTSWVARSRPAFCSFYFRVDIPSDDSNWSSIEKNKNENPTRNVIRQTNKLIFVLLLSLPIQSQVKLVKDKWPRSVDRIARMVSCHTRLISAGLNFFLFLFCVVFFLWHEKKKKELTLFRCWVSVSFTWFGIDERLYISSSANPPLGWLPKKNFFFFLLLLRSHWRMKTNGTSTFSTVIRRIVQIAPPSRSERRTLFLFPECARPLPYNVIIRWLVFFPPILFWLLHRSSCSDSAE